MPKSRGEGAGSGHEGMQSGQPARFLNRITIAVICRPQTGREACTPGRAFRAGSLRSPASVDHQALPGDVAGRVAGEEADRARDLVELDEPRLRHPHQSPHRECVEWLFGRHPPCAQAIGRSPRTKAPRYNAGGSTHAPLHPANGAGTSTGHGTRPEPPPQAHRPGVGAGGG